MLLEYAEHAREQMQERGITEADVEWCIAGGRYIVQPWDGRRKYRRSYQGLGGQSAVFVVTNDGGWYVVTTWIRGADDPGV